MSPSGTRLTAIGSPRRLIATAHEEALHARVIEIAIAAKVTEKSQRFMAAFIEETTHGAIVAPSAGGRPAPSPCDCG